MAHAVPDILARIVDHKRAALAGESAFGRFAVEVGARAVVERGVQIDPDLSVGIAVIFGRGRGFGQAQADEHPVKYRQIRIGCGIAMSGCCWRLPRRANRMVRPDSPANYACDQHDGDR